MWTPSYRCYKREKNQRLTLRTCQWQSCCSVSWNPVRNAMKTINSTSVIGYCIWESCRRSSQVSPACPVFKCSPWQVRMVTKVSLKPSKPFLTSPKHLMSTVRIKKLNLVTYTWWGPRYPGFQSPSFSACWRCLHLKFMKKGTTRSALTGLLVVSYTARIPTLAHLKKTWLLMPRLNWSSKGSSTTRRYSSWSKPGREDTTKRFSPSVMCLIRYLICKLTSVNVS